MEELEGKSRDIEGNTDTRRVRLDSSTQKRRKRTRSHEKRSSSPGPGGVRMSSAGETMKQQEGLD